MKYIACARCNGVGGTMVKIGDSYVHQRQEDCERYRRKQASTKHIHVARPRLYLPR